MSGSASDESTPLPDDIASEVAALLGQHRVPGAGIAALVGDNAFVHCIGRRQWDIDLPVTRSTAFDIASCSKAFLATVTGFLVQEGRIGWDEPIQDFLPELRFVEPELNGVLTVRDLLSNRAGFFAQHPIDFLFDADLPDDRLLERWGAVRLARPFRSGFLYCNPGFKAVSMAIERLTGKPYPVLLNDYVLQPLGMDETRSGNGVSRVPVQLACGHSDARGSLVTVGQQATASEHGAGGVTTTPQDMLSWLGFLTGAVVPAVLEPARGALLDSLWHPQVRVDEQDPNPGLWPPGCEIEGYGLGWAISTWNGNRLIQHSGSVLGWRAIVAILPEKRIGVAIMLNKATRIHAALAPLLLEHLADFTPSGWPERIASWEARTAEQTARINDREFGWVRPARNQNWADYCGTYYSAAAGRIDVIGDDGDLCTRVFEGSRWNARLEPLGEDVFVQRYHDLAVDDEIGGGEERLAFIRRGGQVSGLRSRLFGTLERIETAPDRGSPA